MDKHVRRASEKPGFKKPAGRQKKEPTGGRATIRRKGSGERRQPPERKRPALHREEPPAKE